MSQMQMSRECLLETPMQWPERHVMLWCVCVCVQATNVPAMVGGEVLL